jgi:arylsulfatase A
LYMAHFSVHDPIQGRPDLVEKYKKKLASMPPQSGPDYILEGNPDSPTYPSRAELDELLELPEYADTYKSYPNDLVKVKQKQDNVQLAGMVESVDQSLGTLMAKLKEHGIEDNTIVIFMSDNGGMSAMNGTPKSTTVPKERLNRVTSSSNLPLRGAKGWLYEGGIRVPLIVKWPHHGQIGTVCDEPVISTDFFPTILEMVGVENMTKDIDGKSFTRLVRGEEMDRGPIYWHFPHYSNHGMQSPGGAIRDGDYKLLEYFENGTVQLFNLKDDIGEQNDLSKIEVDKTKELTAKLHQWRKEVDAQMMKPNPDYDAAKDLWSKPAK